MQVAASSRPAGLRRSLGSLDAAALVVSNVIGVGIFTVPGVVAHMAPRTWAVLALWVVGALLALGGALAYAELASLRPYAGAEYVYLHEAFGPLAGFLSGWTSFVAGFSGAIAAGAVGLATYLGALYPRLAGTQPWFTLAIAGLHWQFGFRTIVALGVVLVFSLVHIRLSVGRVVQNALAALNVFTLAALIVAGFLSAGPAAPSIESAGGELRWATWVLALIPVMFTYSGWNAAAYVAEEIRDPQRNIRRALVLGTAVVAIIYLALNALYLWALGPKLDGVVGAGRAAAGELFGSGVARFMTGLMIMALTGSISAMIVAGPRVYFAMARDGLFPDKVARVHPGSHTPVVAIIAQGLWSGVLVLTGTFVQLLIYTGLAITLFSSLAVIALFTLRRRAGQRDAPARRVTTVGAVLFVVATLVMVIVGIVQQPRTAGVALLLIAAGVPVYGWFSRKGPQAPRAETQISG